MSKIKMHRLFIVSKKKESTHFWVLLGVYTLYSANIHYF